MADINSSMEGQYITGTVYDDYITVTHSTCKAYGEDGNDTIQAYTYYNDLYGGGGNDYLIAHGKYNNLGYYDYTTGDDTLASDNENNHLYDTLGSNLFIVGGDDNTATGGIYADNFWIYSYDDEETNVTLTGGGNNDLFVFSTGLTSVSAENVASAGYNPYTSERIVALITDFDAFDSLYIRDYGITAIGHSVTSGGTWLYDNTGRINIFLENQTDWDAIKNATVTYDNAQGNIGTVTLEQAENLSLSNLPEGIYVQGDYMNISDAFVGNLLMSGSVNYVNNNIVTIDARSNNQSGMYIAGNENANAIYAGTNGNSLWGGSGFSTPDILFGGAGNDTFLTGKNDGVDLIFNATSNDIINLYNTNLSDITTFNIDANSINLGYNTGNVTAVASNEVLSPKFRLADGSSWQFNRSTYAWQQA